jgi:molybdate transport system permease protein
MSLIGPAVSRGPAVTRYQPRRRLPELWWALAAPFFLFLLLPLVALVTFGSPADWVANLGRPAVRQAIGLSLRTTVWSTTLSVLLGTPVAYLMARRQFPGKVLLDNLIDLPIVLPPAVSGLALLLVFGRQGWVGGVLADLGLRVTFTEVAVIIAQTFVAASLFVRAATIGFAAVEPELEDAAAIDGATPFQVFWRMTLPLSRMAFLTGVALAWARALGEFGATIIFAGNFPGRTQTMPLAIYLGFELDLELAVTLSVILIGLSFAVLLLVKLVFGRDGREE